MEINTDEIKKRTASLISLCVRAGLTEAGGTKCEKAMQNNEAKLVIISVDASENTKKKFVNKAYFYNVPVLFFGNMHELGKLTGAGFTSSIAITDVNLSKKIKDIVESAGLI